MPRFRELLISPVKAFTPGREFGCVWDSVGPPLLPSDVGEKFETYLDLFVGELVARIPEHTEVERDGTKGVFRIFLTSPKMEGKRSGLSIDFIVNGNTLIIHLRRFLPYGKFWLISPIGTGAKRPTLAHVAIADVLQKATTAALEAIFPGAAPFGWREEIK